MQEIVILCIGSERVIGDSLGPIVGDMLTNELSIKSIVYGRIGANVNSLNISKYIKFLRKYHGNAFIIAVDACLGCESDIGKIKVRKGGVSAGLAVGRTDFNIGHLGLVGIVAESGVDNMMALQCVEYEVIVKLAAKIAEQICRILSAECKSDAKTLPTS